MQITKIITQETTIKVAGENPKYCSDMNCDYCDNGYCELRQKREKLKEIRTKYGIRYCIRTDYCSDLFGMGE